MKKRTVMGILCILLAAAVIFLITPLLNRAATGLTDVVVLTRDVQRGNEITADAVSVIQVNRDAIPVGAYTSAAEAVGQYAASTLYAGDFLTAGKLSGTAGTAEDTLSSLDGTQVAISFPISSFAAGLSGKLRNGDIISLVVLTEGASADIPQALQYVRVITTTTSDGADWDSLDAEPEGQEEMASTVTVLVTPEQARLITKYSRLSTIHAALVCRGDAPEAQGYLDLQAELLEAAGEEEAHG